METKIYHSSHTYSALKVLKESLLGYKNSFYLAKQLAKRDISAQYRQSFLGIFWAFAPIIMNAAVWIFLNGTGTIKLAETNIPYPLFVVIGTTLWSIFSDCLNMTLLSVNSNKSIITKINFDKEALITLGFLKLLFNTAIKMLLIIVFLFVFKSNVSIEILFFFPMLIISMLFFLSIGILLTPLGMLYQDISKLIPVVMQVLMYVTPVVYNLPKAGLMKTLMEWNPITYIIINLRNSLTGFDINNLFGMGIVFIITIILFLFSSLVYRVSMPIITERMSA